MKVFVVGAHGQLGKAFTLAMPDHVQLFAPTKNELDVTKPDIVKRAIHEAQPDVVVNCAAYTRVDQAEQEQDEAFAINADGAAHVAQAAIAAGARVIHISTDYVFGDTQSTPYLPTDQTAPLNVYGASKLAGEERVLRIATGRAVILRTAWLYGRHGQNFLKTMLRLMREKSELRVVADQIGTPTSAESLAQAIWSAAARPSLHGTLHWTDAGVASWYDFAYAIKEEALALGLLAQPIRIHPIRSEDYPTLARRPRYSVLDKTGSIAALGLHPPHWRVALRATLKDLANA
jgi:dTDP-4-dehydrorhamnose reductase